jgi:thymidylate synthase (FAD)
MHKIDVLDKGFVRLVESMGQDSSIVQAARVSYGDGTKTVRDDTKLIHYLMKNSHTSPFEMVIFKFHVKMPIFVARQWVRHRKGSVADEQASMNEISGRYSEMKEEFYLPSTDRLLTQAVKNKQASSEVQIAEPNRVQHNILREQLDAYKNYKYYLHSELARETSRINLPLSLYTEFYWQIDLHNLLHFLKLRLHPHAQYEIRVYAEAILKIIREICPIAVEAWEHYRLNTIEVSRKELSELALELDDIDLTAAKKRIQQLLELANVYNNE